MANSIQLDVHGPDWPLGFIKVVTPGVPVSIMSVVDAAGVNNPNAPQPPLPVAGVVTPAAGVYSYTVRGYRLLFDACKTGASHGTQPNTGNIYIVRKGVGAGTGNRDDNGSIIKTIPPGTSTVQSFWEMIQSFCNNDMFSPYRYFIDADNANDGAYVTLFIG